MPPDADLAEQERTHLSDDRTQPVSFWFFRKLDDKKLKHGNLIHTVSQSKPYFLDGFSHLLPKSSSLRENQFFCEEWQCDHDEIGGSGDRPQMTQQEKPRKK